MTLQTERVRTLEDVRAFLTGSQALDFDGVDREGAYDLVRRTLVRLDYDQLGKRDKGLVKRYLEKITGLSRAQLTRLVAQYRATGRIEDRRRKPPSRPFRRRYTDADIRLLARVDEGLDNMSGPATRAVLRRQYRMHGDSRFERLAGLSNGHLYNLRKSRAYGLVRKRWDRTRSTPVAIGDRRKPDPRGRPGWLRVDTVHQGDLDGAKGVYLINLVDSVTQWEHVAAVEAISERFLLPALAESLAGFPFRIRGFHADNGSEYINHRVAGLLDKLHVEEFTKSRPRRSNDNALVEGKNAAVERKWLGHDPIPCCFADRVNRFTARALTPWLNFHRPCLFPTVERDAKGRERVRYLDADVMTPCEKLESLPDAERFLVEGTSLAALAAQSVERSDLEAVEAVNQARRELFRDIGVGRTGAAVA